jgi:tRNA threonylcarbamoyladenosine biosynthesis protein TsaE
MNKKQSDSITCNNSSAQAPLPAGEADGRIIIDIDHIHEAAQQFIDQMLPGHNVVAFYGKMGAGKTTFIKALCEQLGVEEVITSPTFAIVNEYEATDGAIYHFDFYRIKRLEEVYDMGYEDYFYAPDALCFIEWPELIEELLPDDALRVEISEQPDGNRCIQSR